MGLFDRLRGNDDGEEVELRPPQETGVARELSRQQLDRARSSTADRTDAGDTEREEVSLEGMWDRERRQSQSQGKPQRRGKKRQSRTGTRSSRRSQRTRRSDRDERSTDDADDDADEFILPGMKSVSTDSEEERDSRSQDVSESQEGKLDALLEQNDRIIALLEDVADQLAEANRSTDPSNDTNTDMW